MPVAFRSPSLSSSLGGRIFFTLFLLFPALMGLFTAGLAIRSIWRTAQVYRWEQADCTVRSSSVEAHPEAAQTNEEFRFVVSYEYSFRGQTHAASTYSTGYSGSADMTATRRLADRYRVGARVPCWVDPEVPATAVLVRPSLWSAPLFLAVSLLFLAVGVGGIVLLWKPPGRRPSDFLIQSLERSRRLRGRGLLLSMCVAAAIFGLTIAWLVFGRPAARLLASKSWPTHSCVVRASQVRTHLGGKGGATYNVDILYSYIVDDRAYASNRYDFLGGSSSGRAAKEEIVARYPPGARVDCYVNPADPEDAVLSREWSPFLLLGLLPLAIGLAGTFGLVKNLRSGGPGAAATAVSMPAPPEGAAAPESFGPLVLKPTQTRFGRFVTMLFLAIFWNGITGIFAWQMVASFRRGQHDWVLVLVLSIFVLVGLVLLLGVPYSFLALWNPRPQLTLGRSTVRLGDTIPVEWGFTGSHSRLRRLHITFVGQEDTTTFRGRSSSTRTEVFRTLEIVDTREPSSIAAGTAQIAIPAGDMHSLTAGNRRVVWLLKVAGEIPFWPDVDERFEVPVLPQAERRGAWG